MISVTKEIENVLHYIVYVRYTLIPEVFNHSNLMSMRYESYEPPVKMIFCALQKGLTTHSRRLKTLALYYSLYYTMFCIL